MRKALLLCASAALLGSLASYVSKEAYETKAEAELSLADSGDNFALLDKQFDANDSFVYTADLHFRNGQAGGLAFGSKEGERYYVVNMDRVENRIKLLYFASNGAGGYIPTELESDYFIGNDKMTNGEADMVKPMVATLENVNLKVVLTVEDAHAYAEFFVEGIKRFGIDKTIDLNSYGESYLYEGGYLGMNCFNSDVYLENIEIGKSDYSYFSEPYRNQFHLSPFSKWTNDPNALCYYNGYYHVYYQTNPFGLLWGPMFWGHARSRDLIHFEFLPICLFPEKEGMGFGPGDAYMWSGCAIAYYKGMSSDIDALNWFPNGGGNGMLAIYTRDGGLQDQVVISSDDEGLTWTKRHRIPQTLTGYTNKIDWRDPKVFPLLKEGDTVTMWGMTLSSYALNKGWFLKSTNLLDWSIAGSFALPTPECIGVGILQDEHGAERAYLSNKSRTYLLGTLSYDDTSGNIVFKDEDGVDISTYSLEEMPLKPLDFGPDTYASQSFYISDPASEFCGKEIVLNWFSGDLNAPYCTGPGEYASLRGRWNGGFTMPVEYGLKETSDGYRITQTPISLNNENLEKTNLLQLSNQTLTSESENPLKDIHTHIFEMEASLTVEDDSPIIFRVDVGENEYMQFGWNTIDGYYVDRTYLDDKGINTNVDWHQKYASHILGDSDTKTFYVLSDNGGLEVFCEDFSLSFYFVTTASIYSTGAFLSAEKATINSLSFNEVSSIWRKATSDDEGVLYVSSTEVELDMNFNTSKFVTCWFSGNASLTWELLSGEDVIGFSPSDQGVNLVVKQAGDAQLKVSASGQSKLIDIHVYPSSFDSDFTFRKENIVSGQWIMGDGFISGEKTSGNAFLLSEEKGSDFTYTGKFDILSGVAASLVFRANSDMSSYLVANYDTSENIVKLWSTHGELARSANLSLGLKDISLAVKANGKEIVISANGSVVIQHTLADNEPLEGRFGLNVFSGKAQFRSLSLIKENYEYSGGDLAIEMKDEQFVSAIYNVTAGNVRLEPGFYFQENGKLYIKEAYFSLLRETGKYQFRVLGSAYSFLINVDVLSLPTTQIQDVIMEEGIDATVYIGSLTVNDLAINGKEIDASKYQVKDYTLHIAKDCLALGDNEVTINGNITFHIVVNEQSETVIDKTTYEDPTGLIVGFSVGGSLLLAGGAVAALFLVRAKRRKAL